MKRINNTTIHSHQQLFFLLILFLQITIKKNEITLPDEIVMNKIYVIRDKKVMLDKDLAELYEVTTSNLNKSVKRNMQRFPDDFMFQLTTEEFKNLKFQIGISSWGGTRKAPYAFTEQGVAMLSGVLNSDRAIAVNIQIMRIFTKVRQALTDTTELRLAIEEIKRKTENNTKNMRSFFNTLISYLRKKKLTQPANKLAINYRPKNNSYI